MLFHAIENLGSRFDIEYDQLLVCRFTRAPGRQPFRQNNLARNDK
jgi:hypothetical protein